MTVPPITKKQAYNLGGRKALQGFLAVFIIFELFLLLLETRGDFANGILFFISAQADSFTLGFYGLILLLGVLYVISLLTPIYIVRMSPLIWTIAVTQLAIWLTTTWAIRRTTIARD